MLPPTYGYHADGTGSDGRHLPCHDYPRPRSTVVPGQKVARE